MFPTSVYAKGYHAYRFDDSSINTVVEYWSLKVLSTDGVTDRQTVTQTRGKKILKCSLVLRTSTPKFLLVLLQNNTGHSRKYNLTLLFSAHTVRNISLMAKIMECDRYLELRLE